MKTTICPQCKNKQDAKWQFCHKCYTNLYEGRFNILTSYTPPWANTVKALPGKMDADHDTKVAEAMLSERSKEMRMSRKARSWEQGRKKELMNYKPTWVKKGRNIRNLPK